jgi:undecaprenyl diphosphate synthase
MPQGNNSANELKIPQHLAIIMDGNGRWARERGLPRYHGHRSGVDAVKRVVKAARELGIQYLTLYSFSTENWSRPEEEVGELFKLLRLFIRRDLAELHQNNVRVWVIGDREKLPSDILALLEEAETLTRKNTAQNLVIAFNYGSRQEIAKATRAIAKKCRDGEIDPGLIDEKFIENHLDTSGFPDPDLILRTGGEQRLSNFLLWQAAYSEFVFLEKFWPDITDQDLVDVLKVYSSRKRRFGGLDASEPGESNVKGTGT